ncbi:T9SS type A sorting domain-containing protein [Fulvivirga sp. M361]|nr:T9SS type A sorting domain-containing protein [Fulvivirga sp. M361]
MKNTTETHFFQLIYYFFNPDRLYRQTLASHEKPVEGLSSPGRISIYPNPTENSFINIEFSGLEDKAALQIYTLQGRLVRDVILTKAKTLIALDDIKPGIYTMRIIEKTGSVTKQIVVK